ncbi:MAG: hypothetical protein KBB39_06880 [Phycicoccus sp.]|nr:hypothetical protein [Phycicoccus sp.]
MSEQTLTPLDSPESATRERPETGDLVIDAVISDLAAASITDLDDLIDAGERVQRTLQGRLADLGG